MNLASQLTALRKQSQDLSLADRAEFACHLAKQLEKEGDYEGAREALSEFWLDPNQAPKLEGLADAAKANILLRVGAVVGWLGSANHTEGCQETSKDLITQALDIFERLGHSAGVAEARGDLALCYWREGSYDEARIQLSSALGSLGNEDSDLKAVLMIRTGMVEIAAQRLSEAFRIFNESVPILEQSSDHALKGTFHNLFAVLFRRLVTEENHNEYVDRALIEYAAASFHFEQAGNQRYLARVENNLGYLYFTIGRYTDAHEHLDRARYLFIELKDVGTAAQVDDTRAQTLLAEGRLIEAERLVRSAVRTLERGDEQAVLAEALTTFGTVKARLGKSVRARELLDRAISVAETAGDLEGAGRAKLSIIEELSQRTSHTELASIFESAADLLQQSQDPTTSKRLISCARKVIAALGAAESIDNASIEDKEDIFSLRKEVRSKEKALIERALREAGGSVTKASRLLGFKHHQSLINLIVGRHSDLLNVRSAVRKRRRHLFSQPKRSKTRTRKIVPDASPSETSILHIEDHKLVAQLVKDLLVAENWRVELCADGDTALRKLTDEDRYDVIVVDYELPGLSGLELVKRARKITHRRRTPIIMLSASDYETEAWRAGVDAFLRKPEQINQLPTTISRLLRNSSKA